MNYKTMQDKAISIATRIFSAATEEFLIALAKEVLTGAGIAIEGGEAPKQIIDKTTAKVSKKTPPVTEDAEIVEDTPASAPKKPAAKAAPVAAAEPGKRARATDTEMVVKLTAQLTDAKAKKATPEKIASIKADLDKYTAKVKAAGKPLPTKAAPPVVEEAEEETTEEAPAPAPKAAPKAAAKAPAGKAPAKAAAWNGKCGIIPVKVGDAVIITSETFEEPMKYRVVEVAEGKLKVFPAALDGEPNAEGELAATEEESPFSADWETIEADGSNVKLVKKTGKFAAKEAS